MKKLRKLCFIVDFRSPIAQNWIKYFIQNPEYDVCVISTYPVANSSVYPTKVYYVPLALSQFSKVKHSGTIGIKNELKIFKAIFAELRSGRYKWVRDTFRHSLGLIEIFTKIELLKRYVLAERPDLVHAMRIPFEGIASVLALGKLSLYNRIPIVVSVWGNDFTLHAFRNLLMKFFTCRTLKRISGLHTDCYRDLDIAFKMGFSTDKPAVVLPGNGGIQTDIFYPGEVPKWIYDKYDIPFKGYNIILNPRGFRNYVHQETFFRSIPMVLKREKNTIFVGVGMRDNPVALKWLKKLQISGKFVRLLPYVSREEMAYLFRMSDIFVSPSTHDGTPNTLLEGMASGSFPVFSNLESIKEWITDGVNGLLFDPLDPHSLAKKIILALSDENLRNSARIKNLEIIKKRADYNNVMKRVEHFYRMVWIGDKV